jgi:sortase A
MKTQTRRMLRLTEVVLFTFCLGTAVYFCSVAVQARTSERIAGSLGRQEPGSGSPEPVDARHPHPERTLGGGAVIGRLEVPSLRLSVPILADYQTRDLLHGVGHIPGTAMAGGLGTMGLAGHRDTYFRPLSGIKPKMDIRVSDSTSTYHYEVDSTEIVQPEDVQVLDIQSRPELTLITCYPFNFIGAAPQRFIVHAHLVSALPD